MPNKIRHDNAKINSCVYIDHNFEQALQNSSVCIHAHGFGLKSLCAFACKHNGTCSWSILFSILSFSILFSILSISSSVGPLFFGGGADLKTWTCLNQIGIHTINERSLNHTISERSWNEYSIRFCIWFFGDDNASVKLICEQSTCSTLFFLHGCRQGDLWVLSLKNKGGRIICRSRSDN